VQDSSSGPIWTTDPEVPQPNDRVSLERSYEGFRSALTQLKIPELMELAATQAALLERQRTTLVSESLLALSQRNLDSPVQSSSTTELPSRPRPDPRDQVSRYRPPSSFELLSTSGRLGPRLAGALVRATRAKR
jgi:hypothetical protein